MVAKLLPICLRQYIISSVESISRISASAPPPLLRDLIESLELIGRSMCGARTPHTQNHSPSRITSVILLMLLYHSFPFTAFDSLSKYQFRIFSTRLLLLQTETNVFQSQFHFNVEHCATKHFNGYNLWPFVVVFALPFECRRWPVLVFQPHAAAKTLKMKTGKSHSEKLRIKLRIKIKTRPLFPFGLSANNFYRVTRCMGERGVAVCAVCVLDIRYAMQHIHLNYLLFLRFIFLVWQLCKLSELSTNWYQTFSPWVGRSFTPCTPIFKLTRFGFPINLTHSQQAANTYRYNISNSSSPVSNAMTSRMASVRILLCLCIVLFWLPKTSIFQTKCTKKLKALDWLLWAT